MIALFKNQNIDIETPTVPLPMRLPWVFSEESSGRTGPGRRDSPSPENQGLPRTRLTLLIAEDNPTDVLLVKEAIKHYELPFDTFVVDDGEKALEFIARREEDAAAPVPDIILLDLNLPKRNGVEVLRRLRESPKSANAAIVVFTSSDASEDRGACQQF